MLRIRRCFSWSLSASRAHPDFQLSSSVYHHTRLKTPLVHVQAKDPHKACVLLYRTTPENDKGAAHCLERLVLCGSKRYPVRDPFFSMLSRSLNTYVSSWTGADFTAFPFSTVNHNDFDNLLRVYLDSTLLPLLRDVDFRQEVVRLEATEKGLAFSGAVYEEMKALLVQSDGYLLHQLYRHLFKGTAYQYNSGGEPEAIMTLSNEEIRQYHQRLYHPSNAVILTYGDVDIPRITKLMDDEFLHQFEFLQANSDISSVPRIEVPLTVQIPSPPNPSFDPKAQSSFSVSYLCESPSTDPYASFCLSILSTALHDSQKSPMFQALLGSGLGRDYTPGVGYDISTKEASFTFGLTGCTEADLPKVEKAILKTLSELMEKGVPQELVDSAIHKTEVKHKEVRDNFGLLVLSSMLPYTLHGSNPLIPLYLNDYLSRLRTELAEGQPVFQRLIRRYMWDNTHKVIMESNSDSDFVAKRNAFEAKQLKRIEEEMDPAAKAVVAQEGEELRNTQNSVQSLNVLPTLTLADVAPHMEQVSYAKTIQVDQIPVHFILQPTNGLTYLRIKSNISELPLDLRELVPLYVELFNIIGTKAHNSSEFDHLKESFTVSGFPCSSTVSSLKDSIESHRETLTFTMSFLERNTEKLFDLLTESLTQINFSDHSQLSRQIQAIVKTRVDQMMGSGVDWAVSLAASSLTSAANSYELLACVRTM